MKKFSLLIVILLTGFIGIQSTCNDAKDISLKKGETAKREVSGLKYTITVNDILDNRCPKDVKCIRAGEAFVHAELKPEKGGEQLLQFCSGIDCRGGTIGDADTIVTSEGKIEIKLVSVTPYPVEGSSTALKTANFTINKL